MLLLSDGTVMCQNSGNAGWYRLTPDIHGSYVNGTWTTIAPMHDSRRYYGSQVLRDGRVYVSGGEYGTGAHRMEIYDPLANSWTQPMAVPNGPIDSCTETLPNGNVLQGNAGSDTRIYDITANTYSAAITTLGGQDEPSWVKLQDGSILTLTDTNSERFIPSLNKWVADASVPVNLFGYGYEIGAALLLPNGKLFYIGGTSNTAIYTPWTTNASGIWTPAGTTNMGSWVAGPNIPNGDGAVDAPAAMMVNGKILCCMANTTTNFGSASHYYEYDYVANAFTQINAPTGGTTASTVAYGQTMLDLPDGTVLLSGFGTKVYSYKPTGTQLTNGMPNILSVTTNLDGSFHVIGTQLTGISEGAHYGDDSQMNSDYPVARMTNAAGNVLYCRTYNWSTCNLMTGTNLVTTEMTLPPGMLAGTYPLVVTANGISSAPYSLTILGTPLPAVAGLGFNIIGSNQMAFSWNDIGLTETAYLVQRSTDGTNYSVLASLSGSTTNYTDKTVAPLGQYYYRVLGTNSFGLGLAAPAIFAASPAAAPLPSPWLAQDVGGVLGRGASGTDGGTFTLIGSGYGIGTDDDQFQFLHQPIIGDVTITARVIASQDTGSNAMAGVMIRSSLGSDVADALMVFDCGAQSSIFEHRAEAADLATYGLKVYGEPDEGSGEPSGSGGGSTTVVSQPASAPLWVRLVRSGNTLSGFTSTNGTDWASQGSATVVLAPAVEVGLAVTSGAYDRLNTATFDNVTVTGTAAAIPPPMAEWKLDETSGTTAWDSIDGFDGLYGNVVLSQPGATPASGYSAAFNGTNANVSFPPLNLNSNVLTITGWINRNGSQAAASGIFFNRANATVSGLSFNNSTANELSYTWNNSSATYGWHSGLIVPNNTWTFVALVVEPARARLFMATNGVLLAATNNVSHAAQAFDGTSYLGWDSLSSSRYFKGLLDDVQLFSQALTPAQLAQMVSQPAVNLTSPTNGAVVSAFASVNLSAALWATNGHTPNAVQYFSDDGQLLGQSATPPFDAATTNLNTGSYAVFARLFYDSGLSVDSPVNAVRVSVQPSTTNTWDANAALAGVQDGSGLWGGSGTNWWNGSANVAWTDFSPALFGAGVATNCTVTLANDVTPYSLTFNSGTGSYTLAGTNAIRLDVPGTPLTISANGNATIRAPLRGAGSLTKLGSGTLTLTAANDYDGTTTVAAGLLKCGTNTALGSSLLVTNSGAVDLNGQDFTASMFGLPLVISGTGATSITNSSSTRGQYQDVELAGNATLSSANTIFIGGSNAVNGVLDLNGFTLTKAGSGTVVLNGLTVSGPGNITVNAGTLQLMDSYGNAQQDTALAATGNLTINSGGSVMTYKWGPTLTLTMPVVMNGGTLGSGWPGPNNATYACPILVNSNSTFNFDGGYDSCTLSGSITGSGGLTLSGGSGTRTFTGTNSYGWTTIGAGVLQVGSGGTAGTLGLGVVTNNAKLTFSRSNTLNVTNRISGSGAMIQSGAGTLNIVGTNLFTGGVTLAAGILKVSSPETAGVSGPLGRSGTIAFTGGTLQYSAVNAFDYSARFSTATNQDYSIDTAGQDVTFAAALTSTAGATLTKLGAGTLTLAGANTYDGLTAVGAGTLAVTGTVKGGGAVMVSNGAALFVRANGAAAIITNASSLAFGTGGATTLSISNFAGSANAPVQAAALTPNGAVTVNIYGAPAYGQFPLIKYAGAIGGSGFGAFTLGSIPTNGIIYLSNNTANASIDLVVRTRTVVWSGLVSGAWDVNATLNWTRNGLPSTFTNNDTPLFDDTAPGSTDVTLNVPAVTAGVTFANSNRSYSISGTGAITGSASLVKGGPGAVTLATTNAYSGATTVSGGSLTVNGTLPSGAVTVAASARLAGTGTLYGPTTIQPGGTIQPGLGGLTTRTLVISNSLNLGGSAVFSLNKTNAQATSAISGVGNVTCGGALSVTNVGADNLVAGDSFTLIQATNYSGSFSNVTLPPLGPGLVWDASLLASNGSITIAALPALAMQPAATNLTYGASATLAVDVSGTGPLNWQWYDNHTNAIPGATNALLLLATPLVADSGNYTVVAANAYGRVTNFCAVSVDPAPLTVAANSTNRLYGAANPALTAALTGFVNDETAAVVGGAPELMTLADTNSPVGVYPITVSVGSLSAANYAFVFSNATLTVSGAPLAITATDLSKTYGLDLSFAGTEFLSAGLLNGDTVTNVSLASAGAASMAGVGTYPIVPSLAQGIGLSNYIIGYGNGTLTVTNSAAATVVITNAVMQADIGFSVSGLGSPGLNYVLEATPNLAVPAAWQPVQTNTADANGAFIFTDSSATNAPQGFYRVKSQD
jgi:autotransporter-associated beta strand protein